MTEDERLAAAAERMRRWRAANPEADKRLREAERKRGKATCYAGRQVVNGQHRHVCVRRKCRRFYPCANACDPRFLKDSICPNCLEEAQCTPPP